jgi:hypothetical protein
MVSVDGWDYREGFEMTTVVLECLDVILRKEFNLLHHFFSERSLATGTYRLFRRILAYPPGFTF